MYLFGAMYSQAILFPCTIAVLRLIVQFVLHLFDLYLLRISGYNTDLASSGLNRDAKWL